MDFDRERSDVVDHRHGRQRLLDVEHARAGAANWWSSRSTKRWALKLSVVAIPYDARLSCSHSGSEPTGVPACGRSHGWRPGAATGSIGTERYGFNAFFLRNDCVPDLIPRGVGRLVSEAPHSVRELRQGLAGGNARQ